MKRAYVKPVFFAEEFEATTSVAVCGTFGMPPSQIGVGTPLCAQLKGEEVVEKACHTVQMNNQAGIKGNYDTGVSYWEYAGAKGDDYSDCFLFSTQYTKCDFTWDKTDANVYVWNNIVESERSKDNGLKLAGAFAQFFFGPNPSEQNHVPAYEFRIIPS